VAAQIGKHLSLRGLAIAGVPVNADDPNGMAAETACQPSGLSSQAIIAPSLRSFCRRDGANSTGRRFCSSDCSAMVINDSITMALAATTRSKAAARCTAISTYDPWASRQDAASGVPGWSFADSTGIPVVAQALAKRSRASRAALSRSSACQVIGATAVLSP
jgi:hypothetical protein